MNRTHEITDVLSQFDPESDGELHQPVDRRPSFTPVTDAKPATITVTVDDGRAANNTFTHLRGECCDR